MLELIERDPKKEYFLKEPKTTKTTIDLRNIICRNSGLKDVE